MSIDVRIIPIVSGPSAEHRVVQPLPSASVQALTSIIEPILMIGVGIMVGTIVIAMYLPMFKLLTLIE